MGRVIFGGLIGAVITFIWNFVSWAVLPWHASSLQSFRNQDFVAWVIKENVEKDGVYVIPHMGCQKAGSTPHELKEELVEEKSSNYEGPFVYAQIKLKGMDYIGPKQYIITFLSQLVGAVLISFLLLKVTESTYRERLLFITIMGLIVGVLSEIPNWSLFGGGNLSLVVGLADLIISWFLAGLFMATIVKPKPERDLMM